jgi:trigger factor
LKVTVENLPAREVVLDIEADPEELEHARQHAYRHLIQRVKVPGFRKGKAPLVMLERVVGKAAVLDEAINHLVPEVTQRAIEENKIDAAGTPQIEISSEDPVAWKATVALTPEINLGAYQELRIKPEPVSIKGEQIDKVMEDLRFQQAPWSPVERKAATGDLLTIDVYVEEDGKQMADDKNAQYRIDPEQATPVPGFAEEVTGMGAGDSKEFTLSFPDGHERQDLAGKSLLFRVSVSDIKGKTLPPLDDEFAKGVGDGFDSLKALRDHVKGQLTGSAERDAREALREKALQQLIDLAKVEFSPSMVEHEAEHMIQEQQDRMARNQVGLDQYLESVGKTREQLVEEMKPTAEEHIKRSLVVTELTDKEGIEVSPEEIEAETAGLGAATGEQGEQLRRMFESDAGKKSIERTLLTRKTLDRLAEIVTKDQGAPAKKPRARAKKEAAADVGST